MRRMLLAVVGLLLAVAVALALLSAADEESPDAGPAARETSSATPRTASTVVASPPSATEPEPPPPTTRTQGGTPVTTGGAATVPKPPPYSLAATRRCLEGAGFAVSKVRSPDPRLRALGDLAQQTSLELRRGARTLGVAFGDTQLLLGLLRVPNDPYRLEVRRNALLMYRPSARAAAVLLRGCLRP